MGAQSDALVTVSAALASAGCSAVVRGVGSTVYDVQHAVLSCEAAPLEREDDANFVGSIAVTVDWYFPGLITDGQAEYLAALSAWDAVVSALCGIGQPVFSVDPSGGFEQLEPSADLGHWYAGTAVVAFRRKEPAS